MERQDAHCLGLLRRIAAGLCLIENPTDLVALEKLIEQGYVEGVESTFFGQRLFIDVRMLPAGDFYLTKSRSSPETADLQQLLAPVKQDGQPAALSPTRTTKPHEP